MHASLVLVLQVVTLGPLEHVGRQMAIVLALGRGGGGDHAARIHDEGLNFVLSRLYIVRAK